MAVMAVVFAACGGSKAPATVVGSWVMPINGQPGEVQGIKLEENGEASSINMHTPTFLYSNLDFILILRNLHYVFPSRIDTPVRYVLSLSWKQTIYKENAG